MRARKLVSFDVETGGAQARWHAMRKGRAVHASALPVRDGDALFKASKLNEAMMSHIVNKQHPATISVLYPPHGAPKLPSGPHSGRKGDETPLLVANKK